MSPIGRIFVFINLALSAGFLGWAASNLASSQKYRTLYDTSVGDLAETKATLQAEIADLDAQKAEAERQRSDMRNAKDALENEKAALESQISSKTDELNQLKSNMGNIDSSLGDLTRSLDDMKSQVAQAEESAREAIEAKRDAQNVAAEAEAAKAAAEDRANALDSEVAQLERDLKSTGDKLKDAETTLASVVAQTGVDLGGLGTPLIDGAVLYYYSDLKLVHINRGKDAEVKAGYVFDIYNGGQYKGRARVEVVNATSCTAVMIQSVDGTVIAQGDRCSTQI